MGQALSLPMIFAGITLLVYSFQAGKRKSIMLILRSFLYIICFFSLSWSTLVFGGPYILSAVISSYSNQKVFVSNVEITPKLDVIIGKIEYITSVSHWSE